MDIWGIGCVFFEILSLFPLFPGNDEKDQIHKIHNILGTPSNDVLTRFRKYSRHMDFNFMHNPGTGIDKLIPHISAECLDFIKQLLIYDPDERISSRQAINHPYFKEIKAQENTKITVQRELGNVSPQNKNEENSLLDAQDNILNKKTLKATETVAEYPNQYKKKVPQNIKKFIGGDYEQKDNEDSFIGNINNVFFNKFNTK